MSSRKPGDSDVLSSLYSMIPLLFLLLACVELSDAAAAVDVYRLVQYDISGVPFGSRLAALNHHAASLHSSAGADLSRSVLIIPLRELNISLVKEYISQKKTLGGLLLLLPQMFNFESGDMAVTKDDIHEMERLKNLLVELEELLIHANIPYPVYFAFEHDDIEAVLADIQRNDVNGQAATPTNGGYKFVVSAPEPKKLASPIMTNIQGWLPGLKPDGDTNQLPTIAIVASYDTFGAAPALSVGSDSNGSGVVALLEIARLFSLLYSNPKTRGKYNLLFGLTSGGPYNYNGTHKWLRSFDQRLRETIDYAICLNSIGSWDDKLWLHVSKPPQNAYVKQIYERFSGVAGELGLKVELKHKKINISNPRIAWEHEQFSRLRVTAATLSGLSSAPELFQRTGSLSDSGNLVSEDAIRRSIKLVAQSFARHIYDQQEDMPVFADDSSLAVDLSYVRLWLDLLSRTPRVAPFLTKNDPLVAALKKELAEHTHEVNVQHELLDGLFTFYDSTKAKLNIYQVASVTFDLLLLLAVGSYLIVLFSFLVITTRGLDDLISIFRRPPPRKSKTG
ncbi:unnamed protein product [Linum trigynum]|uniref:Nicalin n=1 Tax=Linum trigynum TaxID=586398 RepID=A0AAV2FZP6_9ROSI